MSFFELIRKRESCRAYTDKPVEREKLIACLEAARMAPSACNSQPWRFVLVDDDSMVKEIAKQMQNGILNINKFAAQVPAYIAVVEDKAKLSASLAGKVKDQHYAGIDIGLATAQMCLAAAELGLGTCIMGWFDEKAVKKLLNVPSVRRIRLMIAIGYPENAQPRTKIRKDFSDIVSINGWNNK